MWFMKINYFFGNFNYQNRNDMSSKFEWSMKIKRKMAMVLVAAMAASLVAGCGGNGSRSLAGLLDVTFGAGSNDGTPDGIVSLSLGAGNDHAKAVAVQADGKIVVAGTSTSNANGGTSNIVVERFNTDGSLDATFGAGTVDGSPDGVVTLDLGNSTDVAVAVKIQTDGKIVVAGTSTAVGNTSNIILARLTSIGELDVTFGAGNADGTPDGVVAVDLGGVGDDVVNAMGIQADGKIVVAGSTTLSGSKNLMVARVNADGTLDSTFGAGNADGTPDGVVSLSLGGGDDEANALAIQSNGQIVIAGTTVAVDTSTNAVVARLNADGTLDAAFGAGTSDGTPDGVVSASFGTGNDTANGLAIQTDGKILVVGTVTAADSTTNIAVARFTTEGNLDTSFGSGNSDGTPDGVVAVSLGSGNDVGTAIALQGDGKILVTGYTVSGDGSTNAAVARMLTDGRLDPEFGQDASDGTPDGVVGISLGAGNDYARDIAVQQDGKILIVGDRENGGSSDIWLARLLAI